MNKKGKLFIFVIKDVERNGSTTLNTFRKLYSSSPLSEGLQDTRVSNRKLVLLESYGVTGSKVVMGPREWFVCEVEKVGSDSTSVS